MYRLSPLTTAALQYRLAIILAWIGALKDLGLMAAAVNVVAMAPVREPQRVAAQAATA
jgi:hypothetical protein